MTAWTCPSCETAYRVQPLIDGVIGCTSCGNVAAAALSSERLMAAATLEKLARPTFTPPDDLDVLDEAALSIRMLLARLSAVEAERDIAAGNLRMAEGETRAAEARAEAAEQALQAVVEHEGHSSDAEDCLREAIETARAALTRSGGTDDE